MTNVLSVEQKTRTENTRAFEIEMQFVDNYIKAQPTKLFSVRPYKEDEI